MKGLRISVGIVHRRAALSAIPALGLLLVSSACLDWAWLKLGQYPLSWSPGTLAHEALWFWNAGAPFGRFLAIAKFTAIGLVPFAITFPLAELTLDRGPGRARRALTRLLCSLPLAGVLFAVTLTLPPHPGAIDSVLRGYPFSAFIEDPWRPDNPCVLIDLVVWLAVAQLLVSAVSHHWLRDRDELWSERPET